MKRDPLDQAIDHVAARLTHVTEDEGLALRIIETLPERPTWTWHWLMPRFAITAGIAMATALVVLRPFSDRSTTALRSAVFSSPGMQPAAVPEHRTHVEPTLNNRRTTVEPSSNDRRTIDVPDFERSLPSLGAVAVLELDSLAPDSLPASEGLVLESLVIADLPLTAEPISPR